MVLTIYFSIAGKHFKYEIYLSYEGKTETIRIYATKSMLDLLIDANY